MRTWTKQGTTQGLQNVSLAWLVSLVPSASTSPDFLDDAQILNIPPMLAILLSALAFVVSTSVALPPNLTEREREAFDIIERATLAPVYTTCVQVRVYWLGTS